MKRDLSKSARWARVIGGGAVIGAALTGNLGSTLAKALITGVGTAAFIEGLTGQHILELFKLRRVD